LADNYQQSALENERLNWRFLKSDYSFFLPAFLTLAHLAFAKADSLALAAALIFLFFAGAATTGFGEFAAGFPALTLAQRALAAAEILARADALMPRFFVGAAVTAGAGGEPNTWFNSFSKAAIFSLRSAA
jgi:hypothetical protein